MSQYTFTSNLQIIQVQSIADAALTEQNEMISGRQRARGAQNGRYGGTGGYAGTFRQNLLQDYVK